MSAIANALVVAGIAPHALAALPATQVPTTVNEAADLNRTLKLNPQDQWVKRNGEFMRRSEANAQAQEELTVSNEVLSVNYFNPIDLVEAHVKNAAARALLLSSMCWISGSRVVGTARNVFFKMHEEAKNAGTTMGTLDAYAEFSAAVSLSWASSDALEGMGLNPDAASMTGLRKLHSIHSQWCDEAMGKSLSAGLTFRAPDLEEMAASPMPMDTSVLEKELALIQLEAEEDELTPAEVEEAIAMAKKRLQDEHQFQAARTKSIAPAISAIMLMPGAAATNIEFWQLESDLQVQMVEAIRRSAKKCQASLSKIRSVTTSEYIKGVRELRKLDEAIEAWLVARG